MNKHNILDQAEEFGVETDINKRWEEGTDHHPESIKLMDALSYIDFNCCNDYFDWNTGGDGDNGETLMYEMDIYFEVQDALRRKGIYAAVDSFDA